MNDRSGEVRRPETPAFELPGDPMEQGLEKSLEKAKESDTAQDSAVTNVKQQNQAVSLPTDDNAVQASVAVDDNSAHSLTSVSDGAENEVIEKHWVERAKNVLSQYSDNPHKQNIELSKVKAEYLKTRFNKILKVEAG